MKQVSLLSTEHAEGLRALSREYDFAAAAGVSVAMSPEEVVEHIATVTEAQKEGRSYVFVLTDGSDVLGVCRLIGVRGVPRLIVSIGGAYRGQGNGSFLVKHVLAVAFNDLQLDRVTAGGACLRLLSQFGRLAGDGLTREEWLLHG